MVSRGNEFLQRLNERVLIGDGAMGSRLYELGMSLHVSYDYLNITQPNVVMQVHREYLKAGAQLLETNTFSANIVKLGAFGLESELARINRRGVELARQVAGAEAFVAGAVGPLLPAQTSPMSVQELSESETREAFRTQIMALAEAEPDTILLETFTDLEQIRWALAEARSCCDLPVIAQMTVPDGRRTPDGFDIYEALESLREAGASVVGTNCGQGVAKVLRAVEYLGQRTDAKVSAYVNAGLPEQVDGRLLYVTTPQYLADSAERMVQAGANLIGGCCGTTATDIAAMAARIGSREPAKRTLHAMAESIAVKVPATGRREVLPASRQALPDFLAKARNRDQVPILVELDPPKNTDLPRMIRGAKALSAAGADAITLGDSPLATLRMSGLMIGSLIEREAQIPVVCHLACRDRNLIGMQSLLLGADAVGIRSILALTGDPAKIGNHPDASSVYDLNSFRLIELIMRMNHGQNHAGQPIGRPTLFHIGVAFNPNKRDIAPEVRRLKRKVDRGATYALTQAVFDAQTMGLACEAARHLGIPIFAAVFPLLSSRHAEFLHHEFPGITVCDEVRRRMALAAPDEKKMAAEGMAIARELIDAFRQCADGLYLIPPFNRYTIALELIDYIETSDPVALRAVVGSP